MAEIEQMDYLGEKKFFLIEKMRDFDIESCLCYNFDRYCLNKKLFWKRGRNMTILDDFWYGKDCNSNFGKFPQKY